jgi:Dolichyl-phosphate-mannose-protein mannosyltransferase
MTEAAVALRERVDRARVAVSADMLAVAGVTLLTLLLAVLTWRTWGDLNSDTGYDQVAAARVAAGEIPFRDFIYYYGPLAPGVLGLLAVFAGAGFDTAIAAGLLVTCAIIAATYLVARTVSRPLVAFLATAITAAVAFTPDNFSYVIPHTTDATLGMLLLLLALLGIARYARSGGHRWLVWTGCCVGGLLIAKVEPALAGLAMTAVWLLVRRRGGAAFRTEVLLVGGPAMLVPAVVYGALLAVVSPHRLLLENLYPKGFYHAAGDTQLKARMPLTPSSFVHVAEKAVLYGLGVVVLVMLARWLERYVSARRLVPAALLAGAGAALAAAAVNAGALRHGLQFAYGWIPLGVTVGLVYLVVRAPRDNWAPVAQVQTAGAAALAVLGWSAYNGFFPHAPYEQMAAYYMPLAAILLASLHGEIVARTGWAFVLGIAWLAFLGTSGAALAVDDARLDSVSVHGPGGALAQAPEDAALYQRAVRWIDRETAAGEPIFVAPMMTGLYPLSDRPGVVDEISMLPGALPSVTDEKRAITELERSNVRVVVTDDRQWPGYGQGAFGVTFDRVLAGWIRTHFHTVARLHTPAWTSFDGYHPSRNIKVWVRSGT